MFIRTKEDVSNLFESRQRTRFQRDPILSYAFSPDEKMFATSRGHVNGDIVLIRNFR